MLSQIKQLHIKSKTSRHTDVSAFADRCMVSLGSIKDVSCMQQKFVDSVTFKLLA